MGISECRLQDAACLAGREEVPTMGAEPVMRMTPEEYLAWEREQETKHEYLEGQVSD